MKYFRSIFSVVRTLSYFVFNVVFAQISGLGGSSIAVCQRPLMRKTDP